MASHSIPIPMSQARNRVRAHVPRGALPLGATVALFAALLILFGWLHFILAMQVTETNQQIQDNTDLLKELRRTNATLRYEVARARSPRLMESKAITAGYQPKQPVHILLARTSSDGTPAQIEPEAPPSPGATLAEISEFQLSSILAALLAELETWWQ